MIAPIINLYKTKEEAFYFKDSWMNQFYRFKGIQLMPNSEYKYIQATNTPNGGIELEDWTVNLVDLCTETKTDITDSFLVEALINSDNGDHQIVWSLLNVPLDNKMNLVYLEVTQTVGETFYSNPFLMTELQKEKTTLFHYKENKYDWYQSIQMQTWYRQPSNITDLTTYYETSTKNTVSKAIKTNFLEIYGTENMNIDTLIQLSSVLYCPYLYVNLIRGYIYKAIEIPTLKAREAFGDITYSISPNKNDVLDLENFQPPSNIISVTSITVKVTPNRNPSNGYELRVFVEFDYLLDFITPDLGNTIVKILTFDNVPFTNIYNPLKITMRSDYITTDIIENTMTIGQLKIVMQNGINEQVYYTANANISFNATEISNSTPKDVILNII